jgi:hypothetical protein
MPVANGDEVLRYAQDVRFGRHFGGVYTALVARSQQ